MKKNHSQKRKGRTGPRLKYGSGYEGLALAICKGSRLIRKLKFGF